MFTHEEFIKSNYAVMCRVNFSGPLDSRITQMETMINQKLDILLRGTRSLGIHYNIEESIDLLRAKFRQYLQECRDRNT